MKRVLSIATLFPNAAAPRFGTFVARSLEALAARGDYRVTVINPIGVPPVAFGHYRALAHAAHGGIENGIEVHRPIFRLIPRIGGPINPLLIARAILPVARRLHAADPFDLVDAQFFFPDGPAAARIAGALGLPLSIKARGADIHYWGQRAWPRAQMRAAAAQAAGLLAVSEALARDMAAIGLFGGKIALHYTGLDRNRFHPIERREARGRLTSELGIDLPANAPLLATVGALIDRKGQRLVIDALADLPADTVLLLVGKGPEQAALRAHAARVGAGGRVHVLGSLDHEVLPLVLSAANAMALPSASEGLANAWVEALACGTPVVISDVGGAREVVTMPEAGRIVAREPAAIAAALRDLIANPPDRERVAASASRFSWMANGEALANYYDTLIARS